MKFKTILTVFIFFIGFAAPGLGYEPDTELVLFKKIENFDEILVKGRLCNTYLRIKKDLSNLSDMRNRFCKGEYSLRLDGPSGTTVTLYGQFFFGKTRGYLVLTKTDDKRVKITEIDNFPAEQWKIFQPSNGTGGYKAFLKPSPDFKTNLASVQWNKIP
ncbi:MAG: hypothetical protein ACI8PD_002460 [Nitrospinales bacterium]|jgi:hypothetical protein